MEMTAKNGEYCKFETLEKREIKANLGDLGVTKQPLLHFNRARLHRNVGWIAPKGNLMEGYKVPFWNEEAAIDKLAKGYF